MTIYVSWDVSSSASNSILNLKRKRASKQQHSDMKSTESWCRRGIQIRKIICLNQNSLYTLKIRQKLLLLLQILCTGYFWWDRCIFFQFATSDCHWFTHLSHFRFRVPALNFRQARLPSHNHTTTAGFSWRNNESISE